ncbi:MAG: RNA polymerase sigma-54 factor, partial [Odoribacter sp.]|nr:RNA polymerase sigma-54 factor [Odoribacter sp.]
MIKLLEVPAIQMEQRIKKELEDNPALEEGADDEEIHNDEEEEDQFEEKDKDQEEFTLDDYIEDDEIPEYRLQAKNYSKDDDKRMEIPFSAGSSFHEHLESQLILRDLTEKQKILGEYILGNIDEDGYLRRELLNIVDDLAFLQNVNTTEEELDEVLTVIQDLEPAGVGARSLRECLLLQMSKRDLSVPAVELSYKILDQYFEEFSKRHYDKITSRLNISEEELKSVIE